VRAGASPVSNILATLPSDTELQLTQRVIDLERERDALAVSPMQCYFSDFSRA